MNISNQAIEEEHETKSLWKYISKLRKFLLVKIIWSNAFYVIFHSMGLILE